MTNLVRKLQQVKVIPPVKLQDNKQIEGGKTNYASLLRLIKNPLGTF